MVFSVQNGEYGKPKVYAFPDLVPIDVLPGFTVDLSTVFYSDSDWTEVQLRLLVQVKQAIFQKKISGGIRKCTTAIEFVNISG